VMTLMICIGVFFVGSIHSYLFGYWSGRVVLARPLGWLCPVLGYFYAVDAITMGKAIPWSFVALAGAYCVCFSAGVFAVGAALFQRRQLEGHTASASMPGLVILLAWSGRILAIAAGLMGLELALSLLAVRWDAAFKPKLLNATMAAMFSADSSQALALIPAAGLLVAAVGGWLLWGFFGRGVRWSYWAVLAGSVVGLARAVAAEVGLVATGQDPVLRVGATILTAATVVILLLPQTRRHFQRP